VDTNIVTVEAKIALIRKQACFRLLNDAEVAMLADLFTVKTYHAGKVIVTQGDHVDSVFLIVSGDADVIVTTLVDGQRQEKNVATLHANQAIGLSETGFYSLSGVRTATVIAKNDMILMHLRVAVFHGFALAHAHVAEVMREFSGSRMQATQS
jgi:CRP-like cAMP-binding protein